MELPALKLPQIELPFDIPVLLHPPVDHFVIAIPVLVLIIELINLVAKKRAIGVISFVLLLIGMVAAIGAYLTGTVDGKEAFDALTQAGQAELKEHKLLGTYLMIGSVIVVIFKLLSSMIKRGIMKALFLLVLVVFTAGILKQGKDGGELVYKYGANVERVADLDSDLFDAKEELDELKEEMESSSKKAEKAVEEAKAAVSKAAKAATQKAAAIVESTKQSATETSEAVQQKAQETVETLKEEAAKMKERMAPATPEIEKVPQATEQPDVATH